MTRPRFSIVIPTREGADTLGATLRTCLLQTFDDYEIIVCDNHSAPAVREIVDGLASPKIKYFRTEKRLPITVNWDYAVSQATGEYVTVVGNDDGLLFHALAAVDELLRTTGLQAVRWQRAQYTWPSYISQVDANLLWLPMTRDHRFLEGRPMIGRVLALETPYSDLPMLYNSCVHRSVLELMREKTGRLFFGRAPDVYSAFAIPYLVGSYLSVDAPMSINGGSSNSNGAAHLFQWDSNPIALEFDDLNRAAGIEPHPWVPELLNLNDAPFAEGFLRAKERLFHSDDSLCLDRKLFAARWVDAIRARSEAEWHAVMAKIRATFQDSAELTEWFDETFASRTPVVNPLVRVFSPFRGFDGESLTLPADRLGIRDVFDAARLCEQLFNYCGGKINYCVPSYHELRKQRDEMSEQWKRMEQRDLDAMALEDQLTALQAEHDALKDEFKAYKACVRHRITDGIARAFAWLGRPKRAAS